MWGCQVQKFAPQGVGSEAEGTGIFLLELTITSKLSHITRNFEGGGTAHAIYKLPVLSVVAWSSHGYSMATVQTSYVNLRATYRRREGGLCPWGYLPVREEHFSQETPYVASCILA